MRIPVAFLFIFIFKALSAQTEVSLRMCLDSAISNHPRTEDKELLSRISENKIANYNSSWLPGLEMKGQLSYQSDVINFKLDAPTPAFEFPTVPRDQYKLYLDLRQTIYDGGKIRELKEVERLSLESSILETENEVESVHAKVIDLYYSVLNLQEKEEILKVNHAQLTDNLKFIRAGIENGVALKSETDLLNVEILETEQEIQNTANRKQALKEMLSSVTGINLGEEVVLMNTSYIRLDTTIERKELMVIEQNREVIKKSADLLEVSRKPLVFAFGQAGYGKPGLNMLNDEFDSYYLIGLGIRWEIWDWGEKRREENNLMNKMRMLENKKLNLENEISWALVNQLAEIQNHLGNISNYERILELRKDISGTYRNQLKKGVIKTSEYLQVLNQEKISELKLSSEKILLQQSIAEFKLLSGNINH